MTEFIDGFDEEYEVFNAGSPYGTIFQSQLWGGVKPAWRQRAVMVRDDKGIRGAMAVLIRRLPGTRLTMMYSPRGPVCDPHDEETLRELISAMRKIAKEERALLLKLDPDIPYSDAEFRRIMLGLGCRLSPESEHFDNVQPQYVVRLSLAGKSAEDVLAGMKSKTRYNLRLAGRRGVTVSSVGERGLDEFCRLMDETGRRDDFITRPKEYFAGMLRALGPHARLYMAYADNEALAGAIAAQYGDKTWYLYGASGNTGREKMPNYLLQWRMIEWAMEGGSAVYDFRGISGSEDEDDPLAGLWRFKRGWGGEKVRFVGEFEYVFRPALCAVFTRLLPLARRAVLLPARIEKKLRK